MILSTQNPKSTSSSYLVRFPIKHTQQPIIMILEPEPKRKRSSSENEEDRLSDLPDAVLVHILSFLNIKEAFKTCILSTRWNNNLLNHLPTLRLNTRGFKSLAAFDDLLSRVLSLRDHSTPVYALKLSYRHLIHPDIVKTMIEYAVSHHVQRLKTSIICDIQRFLPCLLSSQTLTSLNLNVHDTIRNSRMVFPNSLNFPALTTLTLKQFYFLSDHNGCAEPFSAFNNLKTLILVSCNVLDKDDVLQQQQQQEEVLCISSATLVNLTILACNHIRKLKLSAPSLCNLSFIYAPSLKLCQTHLCSVKHFYIDTAGFYNETEDSAFLLSWLVELANIKSLKVSSNTLQLLSFLPDLFKLKFTSLCNLESLQVQMVPLSLALYDALKAKYLEEKGVEFYLYQNTFIPDGVVDFLIQNSPSAKVNIIPFKWKPKS